MKIAYISDLPWYLGFGGKEVQMLKYAEYLSKEYDIQIIFPNYYNKDIDNEIKLFHFFGYSNWFSGLFSIIKNKTDAKIIISPTIYQEKFYIQKLAKFYSRFCFIPNFFSYKRTIFQLSDSVITNSKSESVYLRQLFDIPAEKISIVYNGIEENFASISVEDFDKFPKTYNINPGYVLSVSAITERKNTLNSIKAFLAVSNKINKKLVIIGDYQCTHRNFQRYIEQLICDNKNKILHIPYLAPSSIMLKSAYANCSAHYLPSFIETPGLSNLEASLFHKPILVGDCRPVREYFKNYVTYCNPYSIKDISDKLLNVLNTSPSSELVDYIRSNFSWKKIIEELFKIYQNVMKS